ncbi:MAG: hypothetical protein QM802_18935 [Agriterribacter sp.]
MNPDIKEELIKITALLQDTGFALRMATSLEAAYYRSQDQTIPPFFSDNDNNSLKRSIAEEKIAINIAPFYAVECAIGELMQQKGGTPVEWLHKIVSKQIDSADILVLNRFANATWKAGQPFRDLQRIGRSNFISAYLLPQDEIQKDYDQVMAAADKLSSAMHAVADSSKQFQLHKLSELLKDEKFSRAMAEHIEAAYFTAMKQTIPPFLNKGEDTATKRKSVKEEKIAVNIAGFYALECGLSYMATTQQQLPSSLLREIINDSLDVHDKQFFERLANATWKAGQPFRGLERIKRDTFTCFDLLPEDEINKDWVQIKAAAATLLTTLGTSK